MNEPSGPRVALVTGASIGIGEAIATSLAAEGIAVGLVARREEALSRVQRDIERSGGRAHAAPADLTDDAALRRALAEVERALGPVDILVNNAALVRRGPVHELSVQRWDLQMKLNLRAPFLLSQAVLPGMRARRRGWIINISSEAALEPVAGMGAYAISKRALNWLTELITVENRAFNVRAAAVCPGWVSTELSLRPHAIGLSEEQILDPRDIARTVTWLVKQPPHVQIGPILPVLPTHPSATLRSSLALFEQGADGGDIPGSPP